MRLKGIFLGELQWKDWVGGKEGAQEENNNMKIRDSPSVVD